MSEKLAPIHGVALAAITLPFWALPLLGWIF